MSQLLTNCPSDANFYGISVSETDGSPALTGINKLNFDSDDFTVTGSGDEATISFTGTAAGGSGGFYGITVAETDGTPSYIGINKVNFETTWFYVEQNSLNTDEVVVNFRGLPAGTGEANTASNLGAGEGIFAQKSGVDLQFKSLIAGSNITLTPSANEITIASTGSAAGGGFYGVIFQETEKTKTYKKDKLLFLSNDFYLTPDSAGKPILGLTGVIREVGAEQVIEGSLNISGSGSGRTTDEHTVNGVKRSHRLMIHSPDPGDWAVGIDSHGPGQPPGVRCYKTDGTHENPTAITEGRVAGAFAVYGYDGVEMGQLGRFRVVADADATENVTPGRAEIHTGNLSGGLGLVATFDSDQHVRLENTLEVENAVTAEAFYAYSLGQTVHNASNLGAGSGIFAQKSGVDLQFRSLVAGSNITLTPGADSIEIASTGGGGSGDGGFYGIILKDGPTVMRDDTINFNENDFYLTENSGKPVLNLGKRIDDIVASSGQTARVWVDFDADTGSPVIQDSFGLSSITDITTGIFTLNFSVTFLNTGYCIVGSTTRPDAQNNYSTVAITNADRTEKTTTACNVHTAAVTTASRDDFDVNCFVVFGDI